MVSVQSGSGCTHIKPSSLSLTPHPLLFQTLVHLKSSGVKSYQILPLPFSLHSPSFLTLSLSPPSLTTLPHHPPSLTTIPHPSPSPPSLIPPVWVQDHEGGVPSRQGLQVASPGQSRDTPPPVLPGPAHRSAVSPADLHAWERRSKFERGDQLYTSELIPYLTHSRYV